MRRHKIDRFRGDHLCRHGQIPFVFAIFIITKDDDFPLLDIPDRFFNGVKLHRFSRLLRPSPPRAPATV
jgi:hypothetical protein